MIPSDSMSSILGHFSNTLPQPDSRMRLRISFLEMWFRDLAPTSRVVVWNLKFPGSNLHYIIHSHLYWLLSLPSSSLSFTFSPTLVQSHLTHLCVPCKAPGLGLCTEDLSLRKWPTLLVPPWWHIVENPVVSHELYSFVSGLE